MPSRTATGTGRETPDAPERRWGSNGGSIGLKPFPARARLWVDGRMKNILPVWPASLNTCHVHEQSGDTYGCVLLCMKQASAASKFQPNLQPTYTILR